MFLGKLPEYPKCYIHDVKVDLYCLQELYRIYNGKEETKSNRKSNKRTNGNK